MIFITGNIVVLFKKLGKLLLGKKGTKTEWLFNELKISICRGSIYTLDSHFKYGKRKVYFPKTIPCKLELVVEKFKDNGMNYEIL